jgi:hypothetical protein
MRDQIISHFKLKCIIKVGKFDNYVAQDMVPATVRSLWEL